ncbi:hypothetical protein NM688_g7785 [Phlebia brevispora]|uniref:Uncharacterized protein n=1 Tax=Phlebia brevispora TaxID=194682 RepID=A0ACC1S158_9APHY|nr:hypothetical protein NM688_g7785 [Phlebia brevispora]
MGIKGLTALLVENSPKSITVFMRTPRPNLRSPLATARTSPSNRQEHEIKTLFGRKVAIDASMSIYQFLIAFSPTSSSGSYLITSSVSHLMGFFYRTIRMVENGIKPAYVFDGKPPELKAGVLSKRLERREEAKEEGEEAKETGTTEDMDRFSRRTVKVTREHNEECRRLLTLMGIPFVIAPSEAEAQCAELARGGKVYAAGSEDMDTLTFGAPVLLRHLTFSEARKTPISEIHLDKALEGLEMNMSQFIELCLLLGCDYLEPIRGVGPKSALKLVREFGSLDKVLENLREKAAAKDAKDVKASKKKAKDEEDEDAEAGDEDEEKEKEGPKKPQRKGGVNVPEEWPWEEAKKIFEKPDVTPADQVDLEWKNPDVEGLVQFLVNEKGFNEERVRKGAEKLTKFMNAKQQGRLDGFFTAKPKAPSPSKDDSKGEGKSKASAKGKDGDKKGTKRKADDKEKASGSKKPKKSK